MIKFFSVIAAALAWTPTTTEAPKYEIDHIIQGKLDVIDTLLGKKGRLEKYCTAFHIPDGLKWRPNPNAHYTTTVEYGVQPSFEACVYAVGKGKPLPNNVAVKYYPDDGSGPGKCVGPNHPRHHNCEAFYYTDEITEVGCKYYCPQEKSIYCYPLSVQDPSTLQCHKTPVYPFDYDTLRYPKKFW